MTDPYDPKARQDNPPAGYGPPQGDGSSQSGYGPPQSGYGSPQGDQGQHRSGGYGTQKKNGFGVAALVLGIIALVSFFTIVGGILFGVLALIFGILGRKRVSRNEADNGGVALAGIITGALGLLGAVIFLALAIVVGSQGDFDSFADCTQAAQTQAEQQQCAEDFADSITN